MDFNIEVRKKQLENLNQLVESSKSRIESVLNYLEWTPEKVRKDDPLVQCPINLGHRISRNSWTNHIEKCILTAERYSMKDEFLSESVDNAQQSIYLDRDKKIEIITRELAEKGAIRLAWNGLDPDPRTADRMTSTFSSDERLAFYNYSIQNTSGPPPPQEFTTLLPKDQKEMKELSYSEVLRQERDAKRRRVKYKSVHLNRKSHTEVMREVISGQMEEYKEWLEMKNGINNSSEDKRDYPERPHSSISRNSTHSGSSRRSSSRRDKRGRSRDRSKDRHYNSREYSHRHRSRERERYHGRKNNERERHSREKRH